MRGRAPTGVLAAGLVLAFAAPASAPVRAADGPSWSERVAALRALEPDGVVIALPAAAGGACEPCVRVERAAEITTCLEHLSAASPREVLLVPGISPEVGRLSLLHGRDVLLDVTVTALGLRVPLASGKALAFTSAALVRWTLDRLAAPDRRLLPPRTDADVAPRLDAFARAVAAQGRAAPERAVELVVNGGFEEAPTGARSPLGWDRVDGLTSFWIVDPVDPKGHGHVLRLDTDVYESEWKRRQDEMAREPDAPPWPKTPVPEADQYATVGGNHGVSVYSAAMPVEPGRAYRLRLAFRTDLPRAAAKVWVRGYGTLDTKRGPESRRLYDALVTLRMGSPGWKTHSMVFHPTKNTPSVTTMKVMLYGYWPRGGYAFDDVSLVPISDEEYASAKETERSDEK